MKKIGLQSISVYALAITLLLTGCSQGRKSNDKTSSSNYESETSYSEVLDDTTEYFTSSTEVKNEVTSEPQSESIPSSETITSTDVTSNESYCDDEPCYLYGPDNTDIKEIPNDNFDAQVCLVNDLNSLDNIDTPYTFFDDSYSKEEIYDTYKKYVEHIKRLEQSTTTEDIVEELNNLYILSQTPSCVPDEVWEFYFGDLDALKVDHPESFYEEYFELADFIHQKALKNEQTLKLENNK